MPFKSQQQRKWMFATHPKMAKKWAAHTHGKLPKKVSEMPHFDSDTKLGGKPIGIVDLRLERLPMPAAGRKRLEQDFARSGLVGQKDGKWLWFKSDYTIDVVSPEQAQPIPHLPDDWEDTAEFLDLEAFLGLTHITDEEDPVLTKNAIAEASATELDWKHERGHGGEAWAAETPIGQYEVVADRSLGYTWWQFHPSVSSVDDMDIEPVDTPEQGKQKALAHWKKMQQQRKFDEPLKIPPQLQGFSVGKAKTKKGTKKYSPPYGGTKHGQRSDYLPPDLNSTQRSLPTMSEVFKKDEED